MTADDIMKQGKLADIGGYHVLAGIEHEFGIFTLRDGTSYLIWFKDGKIDPSKPYQTVHQYSPPNVIKGNRYTWIEL